MTGLLAGVEVVDLSRVLAGPFAAQALAELGADVVKVESPDGDPARRIGPFVGGRSLYFASLNTGKRSVVLDLATASGRNALDALLDRADIVIENFRPGAGERLGVDGRRLAARHPQLVVVSVPGYASASQRGDDPAYDLVVQAESGIMAVTGEQGRAPVRAGVPIGDLAAGLWAAIAAVAGYVSRLRTGSGRHIEAPLFDATLTMLSYIATIAAGTGVDPPPVGSGHHTEVPYGAYPTRNGWVAVAVIGDKFWPPLLEALGLGGSGVAELTSNDGRSHKRGEVDAAVATALAALTTEEACTRLAAAGVPHAPVLSVLSALGAPYVAERGLVVEVDGDVRYQRVRGPIGEGVLRPAPGLGEHTAEIMAELIDRGVSPADGP